MVPKILDILREEAVAELFWGWCEFAALNEPAPSWFALESKEPLQVVGRDACGGYFCLFPASLDFSGRLLFIDSEGHAGVIADSLSNGIRMMIELPTWRDCLKFSSGGILEEMRKAESISAREFQASHPDAKANRQKLFKAFSLVPLADPMETLHRAVSEGRSVKVIATVDGSVFQSLFGGFAAESCRTWKQ